MNKPTIQTIPTTAIDHAQTGLQARIYRKQARVSLTALAEAMGLDKAQLSHMELGRRKWNGGLLAQYVLTCDKLSGNIDTE